MENNIIKCILSNLKIEELKKLIIRIDEEMCFIHDEKTLKSFDTAFDLVQKELDDRKRNGEHSILEHID